MESADKKPGGSIQLLGDRGFAFMHNESTFFQNVTLAFGDCCRIIVIHSIRLKLHEYP